MNIPSMSTIGYAELITRSQLLRRKNRFVKFLLVFPAAFMAYAAAGGVGPMFKGLKEVFEPLIVVLQIALFLHFIGKGDLIRGFQNITLIFNKDAWNSAYLSKHLNQNLSENWPQLVVNIAITYAIIFGMNLGFAIASHFPPVQLFLEKFNILYPNAGATPIYQFWLHNALVPIVLSIIAVMLHWLILDKINEKSW